MSTLVCTVDVTRPVEDVATHWSHLEGLPAVLPSVVAVKRLDERRSSWSVRIRGEQRTFEATTTEVIEGARLAWKADGETTHAGVVDFHRLGPDRTRISVQLDWTPSGLFDQVGDRTGLVRRAIQRDLEAFARHVDAAVDAPAAGRRNGTAAGRSADSPTEIPPEGWLQVLKRTMKQLKADNVPVVSGGVAYYSFLAVIPALAAIVSIYGIVADPEDVGRQLESFFGALPDDAAELLRDQIRNITEQQEGGLGLAAVIGVLASLWSASKGMQALIAALNIAYDEEEGRKGLRLRAITLGMTVALAVGATGLIAGMIGAGAVAGRLGTAGEWALTIARWPALFAALVVVLAVLYRYAPDRDDAAWRWVTPGAALAAALVVLGSFAFALYVNSFGKYSETYGSLGAIVVLLLWLNLTAYVVVLGAELDAELERQTARDTTTGPRQPMGERKAYAADTVAV